MQRLLAGMAVLALALAGVMGAAGDAGTTERMAFGMDAYSVAAQEEAGVKPDLATIWIGPWTLESGWGGPNAQLAALRQGGVTPAIHYYYWGDDISPTCVTDGCWSDLHQTRKNQAGWQRLAEELVAALQNKLQGATTLVLIETEFNKNGIETWAPFDDLLAEKAEYIRMHYPAARIVLPFGNWNPQAWENFPAAMSASDAMGIQGMRGSTRHSETEYLGLFEATRRGAERLHALAGKPVVITDVALSTYPEPEYLEHQRAALARFFDGRHELEEAGVEAIIYRSWYDTPKKDTANWFGIAERHWGLSYANGTLKPGAEVWIEGVTAARAPGEAAEADPPSRPPGSSAPEPEPWHESWVRHVLRALGVSPG